jgi:hypothetical protein
MTNIVALRHNIINCKYNYRYKADIVMTNIVIARFECSTIEPANFPSWIIQPIANTL